MKKVLVSLKLLLADVAQLQVPGIASTAAGAVAIILGLFGVNFSAAAIAVAIGAIGTVAGVIEKIVSGQAAAAAKK